MMRNRFDMQLDRLNTMLIEMGGFIEASISSAIRALETQDISFAHQVINMNTEVSQREKDIESLCMKLLLQQQPVARDLRLISAALKMITDMERIGVQAADIAEISIDIHGTPYIKDLDKILEMATASTGMVTKSIEAFVQKDVDLAEKVIAEDDVVDELFEDIKVDLIMLIHNDSIDGEQAIDTMMIAKYLERIGDHAVNIADWVIFSITGKHTESFIEG